MAKKSPDTKSSLNNCRQDEISAHKKSRGKNKNYFSLCSFRDYSSANKALKETFDNQKWRKGNIKGGDKRYYSCNTSGVKSDCPVRMYLFMHSDSQICTVYMSTDEHNHPGLDTESDSNRLSFQIRQEIIRIYENETHQTNLIIEKLRMKNFKATRIQIYNLIHRYKINQSESKNTTLNQLRDYCSNHKSTPLDPDQVYIPDTYFRYGLNALEDFRIFLTTKRLVQMAAKAKCVHIDVTYKLLWHGLPVIIIGTTDCSQNFHPFGLTICKHHNENDFAFTFEAVKQQLKLLYSHEMEPSALVAEADPAIEQAFRQVFKNKFERVLSWPYVLKKIDSKLNTIKDNKIRKCIREDIINVQLHAETYNFKSVVFHMLKKWQNYQLDSANLFVDFFRENWIEKNSSWFEAFAPQIAKTNNALDLIDALVKKENSFRKQLPAADFLDMVSEKLLKRWSSERSESHSGPLLFKSCAEPSLENWRSAWQWELLHNDLSISKKIDDTCSIFYIPSEKLENVDEELIENYKKCTKSSDVPEFDTWLDLVTSVWTVTLNQGDYKKSTCTCSYWRKMNMCKHVIALACRQGDLEWHPNAKDVPLVEKIKKDRPNSSNSFLESQIAGGAFVEKFSANEKNSLLKAENNQENLEPAMKQKKRGRPAGSKNLGANMLESSHKKSRQL